MKIPDAILNQFVFGTAVTLEEKTTLISQMQELIELGKQAERALAAVRSGNEVLDSKIPYLFDKDSHSGKILKFGPIARTVQLQKSDIPGYDSIHLEFGPLEPAKQHSKHSTKIDPPYTRVYLVHRTIIIADGMDMGVDVPLHHRWTEFEKRTLIGRICYYKSYSTFKPKSITTESYRLRFDFSGRLINLAINQMIDQEAYNPEAESLASQYNRFLYDCIRADYADHWLAQIREHAKLAPVLES